jgi:hypothetical protein
LTAGNKIAGAAFVSIAGDGVDLTDITVTGYDSENGCEGEVNVQSLDANGKGGMTYFYYDIPGEFKGWFDGNEQPVELGDVILAPGEGLWVSAPNENYALQTSGSVPTADIAVALRSGNKIVINSTPITVDLTDILVSGYDEMTEGDVNVQSLDANGKGGMTYFFYDIPGEFMGWFDGNEQPVESGDVTIAPAEGLWVASPTTSFNLVLPGVSL